MGARIFTAMELKKALQQEEEARVQVCPSTIAVAGAEAKQRDLMGTFTNGKAWSSSHSITVREGLGKLEVLELAPQTSGGDSLSHDAGEVAAKKVPGKADAAMATARPKQKQRARLI